MASTGIPRSCQGKQSIQALQVPNIRSFWQTSGAVLSHINNECVQVWRSMPHQHCIHNRIVAPDDVLQQGRSRHWDTALGRSNASTNGDLVLLLRCQLAWCEFIFAVQTVTVVIHFHPHRRWLSDRHGFGHIYHADFKHVINNGWRGDLGWNNQLHTCQSTSNLDADPVNADRQPSMPIQIGRQAEASDGFAAMNGVDLAIACEIFHIIFQRRCCERVVLELDAFLAANANGQQRLTVNLRHVVELVQGNNADQFLGQICHILTEHKATRSKIRGHAQAPLLRRQRKDSYPQLTTQDFENVHPNLQHMRHNTHFLR